MFIYFFHKGLMVVLGIIITIIAVIAIVILVNKLTAVDYGAVRNAFAEWMENLINSLQAAGK